jgi:hypothetical protein
VDVLAGLRELAPPQGRPPAPDPWASPRALPPDLMQLAIQWGPRRFGGLLWLLAPGVAYWRVDGEPGEWSVVVNEGRGPEWHEFPGGAAEFLLAWLTGHERVAVFPDDVPDPRDPFTAWTPG